MFINKPSLRFGENEGLGFAFLTALIAPVAKAVGKVIKKKVKAKAAKKAAKAKALTVKTTAATPITKMKVVKAGKLVTSKYKAKQTPWTTYVLVGGGVVLAGGILITLLGSNQRR